MPLDICHKLLLKLYRDITIGSPILPPILVISSECIHRRSACRHVPDKAGRMVVHRALHREDVEQ
jgi:hypothetical protein